MVNTPFRARNGRLYSSVDDAADRGPAAYEERLTGDERGLWVGEEHHGAGDVVGSCEAAGRYLAGGRHHSRAAGRNCCHQDASASICKGGGDRRVVAARLQGHLQEIPIRVRRRGLLE
jgi:hypothetical protein